MKNRQALRNGLVVVAVLVATSLVAVLWPSLTAGLGSNGGASKGVSFPSFEATMVTLPDLALLGGLGGTEVNGLLVIGALAGGVLAVVVGAGLVLGLLYTLLARIASNNAASETVVQAQSALQKKEQAAIKAMNADRTTTAPNAVMPRWAVISTSLIVLFFVALLGMVVNAIFTAEKLGADLLASPVVGGFLLVALALLGWRMRPQRLLANDADTAGVPWDFVAVLVTGLLVVGISIGWLLYINAPA